MSLLFAEDIRCPTLSCAPHLAGAQEEGGSMRLIPLLSLLDALGREEVGKGLNVLLRLVTLPEVTFGQHS